MSAVALRVLDLETTGVDPETARIVSAYVGDLDADGQVLAEWSCLVNPGVPIPKGASDVHGITDAMVADENREGIAVAAIFFRLDRSAPERSTTRPPWCVFNASYDITVIDRALRREFDGGIERLTDIRPIIDPYVIDKRVDTYRKGSRKLVDMAATYGVTLPDGDPHGARFDAITAGRIALALRPALARIGGGVAPAPSQLHEASIGWARTQRESFADYLRSRGKDAEADAVRTEWPLLPIDREFGR